MVWKFLWRKKSSLTPGEAASKRRLTIFALCLLLSALFWLFSKLTQETSASFSKHIHFQDYPEGLVVATQTDSLVDYRIITTGLRLFNAYFFRPSDTLRISVNGLPVIQRNGAEKYVVTDSHLYDLLSDKVGGLARLSQVRPDSVFLELVPAKRRKLPIRLNADIQFARRFRAHGAVKLDPDSIWVTGPANIVDTLQYVNTKFWSSGDLRETTRKTLELQKPVTIKSFELAANEVTVEVPVTEFTESSIELPVVIHCPDEYAASEVRLFPGRVQVSYVVSLHDYASVVPDMFLVTVICPQVQQTTDGRLDVTVEKHPPFIQIISIKPPFVEYLILE